jgi:F-type H+-transporting ATPase subunit a
MLELLIIIVSAILIVCGYFWRSSVLKKIKATEKPTKGMKSSKRYSTFLMIIGGYVLTTKIIELVFGKQESKGINVEIAPARMNFLGMDISSTVVIAWGVIVVLVILALILRLTVIPRLKDVPTGAQNVLELAVETVVKYTKSTTHGVGEFLASYIFTVAIYLVGCAFTELFGLRTPASDITQTGALAIVTFFFINYYGFKNKGFGGRIKTLASPTPVVFPIRIITDLAIPVSLACRLFGNMLGGLVVMDLLYTAMGGYAIGVPSLAGLYFNVFHPLIQAFIFVTLTLTFINEATE